MQPVSKLGVLLGLLLYAGAAQAGEWRGYLSLGAGMALDHMSEWDAKGAAINAYFGVEAPVGLSLGIYGEAAETWGQKLDELQQRSPGRIQLDYRQYGLEVRMRVFRERMFSPWLAVRLARSESHPLTPDEFGQLVRQEFQAMSAALRFGIDMWLGKHWGATAATSWQWCDVRYEQQAARQCAKPINSILVGPTLRF
ncbi:hypothetical protein [Hyalangium rubrum]|uniref:Outer membrane protein beta-barrel domain-containing protein n=1 Tax=Hyalangium rubrum TaxID=3103134 RepID=A0ABU5H9P3_9BACT|nr:hypothetical protein [Hyalangium sp. s54d21]MDY7230040.1 hypothetical protein [Hyalangium sp. s54d21]